MRLWKTTKHDASAVAHMVVMHSGAWVEAWVVGVPIRVRLVRGWGNLMMKNVGLVDSAGMEVGFSVCGLVRCITSACK